MAREPDSESDSEATTSSRQSCTSCSNLKPERPSPSGPPCTYYHSIYLVMLLGTGPLSHLKLNNLKPLKLEEARGRSATQWHCRWQRIRH